jgi:hypothetical protein
MLIVETIARIRREHFIKGKTIKEIARDLKVFFDQRISAGFFRRGPPDYAPLAASSSAHDGRAEHAPQRPPLLGRSPNGACARSCRSISDSTIPPARPS